MAFSEKFHENRDIALQGKTTRERGTEKTIKAISWVYRWGYSFPTILDQIGNVKARGLTAKLVKKGILKETKTGLSAGFKGVPNKILTLTNLGMQIAETHTEIQYSYETDPHRVRQDQLHHYFIAQKLTIDAVNNHKIQYFKTEKEYAAFSENGVKQPDVIWVNSDNEQIGIEVELTGKWERKLDQFVDSSLKALKVIGGESRLDYIVIFAESDALIKRYKAAFQADCKYSKWVKNQRGYWQKDIELTVPSWITGRILCKKL